MIGGRRQSAASPAWPLWETRPTGGQAGVVPNGADKAGPGFWRHGHQENMAAMPLIFILLVDIFSEGHPDVFKVLFFWSRAFSHIFFPLIFLLPPFNTAVPCIF